MWKRAVSERVLKLILLGLTCVWSIFRRAGEVIPATGRFRRSWYIHS